MLITAVNFSLAPYSVAFSELLIAMLDAESFEGIHEDQEQVIAYIPSESYHQNSLLLIKNTLKAMACVLTWEVIDVPEQNWNSVWESNFEPVLVDTRCAIRAPFHPEFPEAEYQITIEPKMSFGTGHHQTTRLMVTQLLEISVKGKSVLDIGCGTGVLGILSGMRGAEKITAIDIDEWAYKNTIENAARNNVGQLIAIQGGKEKVPNEKFDIILANINRNILLDQMNDYASHCQPKGLLMLSGILLSDRLAISESANSHGFQLINSAELDNWLMLLFEMN